MQVEIGIAGEHGGEVGAGAVIEDVHRLAQMLCKSQFIPYAQRGGGAFGNHQVRGPEPGRILLINSFFLVGLPLCFAERQIPHVFREYNVALLDVFYHLPIQIGIGPSAPDGTGEINFLHMG